MTAQLHRELMCANCHRSGDSPSHGAAINSQGCTGACLQWAREIIEDSHRILTAFGYELTRSRWPHIVACVLESWLGASMSLAARTYSGRVRVARLISDANMIGLNGHVNVIVNTRSFHTLR